jgi:hypothetical protein
MSSDVSKAGLAVAACRSSRIDVAVADVAFEHVPRRGAESGSVHCFHRTPAGTYAGPNADCRDHLHGHPHLPQ